MQHSKKHVDRSMSKRGRNLIKFHSFPLWCQSIFMPNCVRFLGRKELLFCYYYFNFSINCNVSSSASKVSRVTVKIPSLASPLSARLFLTLLIVISYIRERIWLSRIHITITLFIYAISFLLLPYTKLSLLLFAKKYWFSWNSLSD